MSRQAIPTPWTIWSTVLSTTLLIAALLVGPALWPAAGADSRSPVTAPTVVYLVEHGEPDFSDLTGHPNDLPLSKTGRAYAQALTMVLTDVGFTDVFSSQTLRSEQTVSLLADDAGLPVVRLPEDQPDAPTAAATEPIVAAVTSLPPGSIALVGGNTENLFPIMTALGVPVRDGCQSDEQCLPCPDRTCFGPNDLNSIWQVTIYPGSGIPTRFQRLHTETPNIIRPPRHEAAAG